MTHHDFSKSRSGGGCHCKRRRAGVVVWTAQSLNDHVAVRKYRTTTAEARAQGMLDEISNFARL